MASYLHEHCFTEWKCSQTLTLQYWLRQYLLNSYPSRWPCSNITLPCQAARLAAREAEQENDEYDDGPSSSGLDHRKECLEEEEDGESGPGVEHPPSDPAPKACDSETGECKQETPNPPPTNTALGAPSGSSTTPAMPPPTGTLSALTYMDLTGMDPLVVKPFFWMGVCLSSSNFCHLQCHAASSKGPKLNWKHDGKRLDRSWKSRSSLQSMLLYI